MPISCVIDSDKPIQRMYPPTDLGAIKFDITITRKHNGKNKNGKPHDRLVKRIRMTS